MKTRTLHPATLALTVALIALACGFRLLRATLLPEMPNFAPIMAIALCGALVLPGALAFAVPMFALIVSDGVLNAHYGVALFGPEELIRYACYGVGVLSGLGLRRAQAGTGAVFGGVTANTLLFYLVSNTVAFVANPAYARTAAGWVQALTVGVPGFAPTWMFLGYSLASDLLFTAAFLGVIQLASRRLPTPALARA